MNVWTVDTKASTSSQFEHLRPFRPRSDVHHTEWRRLPKLEHPRQTRQNSNSDYWSYVYLTGTYVLDGLQNQIPLSVACWLAWHCQNYTKICFYATSRPITCNQFSIWERTRPLVRSLAHPNECCPPAGRLHLLCYHQSLGPPAGYRTPNRDVWCSKWNRNVSSHRALVHPIGPKA